MKQAIFSRLIILTFIAILICSLIAAAIFSTETENQTREWLTKLTISTAENYKYNKDVYSLSKSAGDNRITIIAPDGTVLADSETDVKTMENHADRKEVKYARDNSVYVTSRTSQTLGEGFMYASTVVQGGDILRLAHGFPGFLYDMNMQLPAILAAVSVAFFLSLFLAARFSGEVMRPLEKLVDSLLAQDYEKLLSYKSSYYEVDRTLSSIKVLLQRIEDSKTELNDERERFDYVLSNIAVDATAEKSLEEQKRDFFSNASHELKTPVTSILGFSEMLNAGIVKSESEKTEIMGKLEKEAKRLSELINDILTVSRLESNNVNAEYADFNFADVVKEAADSVLAVKDGTPIEINLDLEHFSYHASRRQIHELCVNLIENAVKYNEANGKVYVSLKTEDGYAVLTVKDTGIGIAPEYQARVFERFFRVDYGRDKKVGGTGLGLSIVKHIVNIYDGKISLQSKMGEGTTIEISLPIRS